MFVLRLTSHDNFSSLYDGFFFTLGQGKADSVPGDHILRSCSSRHACDWTVAGHYKSILVILIVEMMERRGGEEGRGGRDEGRKRGGEEEGRGGREEGRKREEEEMR